MRHMPVSDQDAEPAVVEKCLVDSGNAIDDAGNGQRVVRPSPLLACQSQAGRDGAIDVGEFIRLDVAVCHAGTHEYAQVGGDLLLEIHAYAAAAGVLADRRDVGWHRR